ncbi:MAG: ribonuclease E/G [Roseburia sp.]|nr:ribonuclease E/G [Roseburia sp.]
MSRNIMTNRRLPDETELALRNTGEGKLLFTVYEEHPCALLLQDNRLTAAAFFPAKSSKMGGIYIGRIRDAVKNMDAYFVEIQKGEICFLSGREARQPVLTGRNYDGRLLQGDELVVRVIKDAQKTKLPMLSANFAQKEEYEAVLKKAGHKTCFTCLQEPPSSWQSACSQLAKEEEYTELITDDSQLYPELVEYAKTQLPGKKVRLYEDTSFSLSMLYSLKTKLEGALEKRVWLKSGAYLIIEPTEALTVIDVNSGKCTAKKSCEEYYLQINREAAREIALQLRLRNLSGMILVDFINMKSRKNQEALLQYMRELLKDSMVKTSAVDMTPLGLMEITRQKKSRPLHEQARAVGIWQGKEV